MDRCPGIQAPAPGNAQRPTHDEHCGSLWSMPGGKPVEHGERMDFSLDLAHLELQDSIRGFARRTLGRGDRRAEDEPVFSRDLWKACGEFGIQGLPFPPEYGGSGAC